MYRCCRRRSEPTEEEEEERGGDDDGGECEKREVKKNTHIEQRQGRETETEQIEDQDIREREKGYKKTRFRNPDPSLTREIVVCWVSWSLYVRSGVR